MAADLGLGSSLAGMGSGALNFLVMIILIIIVGAIIAAFFILLNRSQRYKEFKVVIWHWDGFGQFSEKYDKAGIFVDKRTKNKRLFLQKNNVGLTPDNIPYLPSGKTKVVYLLQVGLKNFRFIKPNISKKGLDFTVGEEDVNWGLNAYERGKKLFSQTMLGQILPYAALFFVGIIILVLFIYLFKNMGVLKDVALAFKDAAKQYALAQSGTTLIP